MTEENTTPETAPESAETETAPAPAELVRVNLEESRGIKETKEVLKAVDRFGDLSDLLMVDGRIDGSDLNHVVSLLADIDIFIDAGKGITEVDDELKDLDQAELLELGAWAYQFVSKRVSAAKKWKAARS